MASSEIERSAPWFGIDGDATGPLALRRAVLDVLGCWHWFVLTFVLVALALVALIRVWPEQYNAVMVVGPVAASGTAGMGPRVPLLPQDRTVSLAEHTAQDQPLSDFARFLNLLTTPVVAQRLLPDQALMHRLFPDRWDAETRRWQASTGLSGRLRRAALWLVGWEDWTEPDAIAVSRHLRRLIGTETLAQGAMHRIRVRHPDRATALAILEAVYRAADRHLREEAARRIRTQLGYVEQRLETVRASTHREALGTVRAEFQRLIMMLEVDLPFAADLIEPPTAAQRPEWPDKMALLLLVLPSAFVCALLVVFLRVVWRRGG